MQSGTIIRHIYIILALSFCTYITKAQHGIGTSIPDASTVLDISSANKGVLLPRVALTGTGDITTIANAATSLLVYNTATAGTGGTSVSPGYYYWTGTLWQRISGDNLGNHIATQNIELGGNYLSNDGGNEGIFVATDGKVGIGTNTPASTLNVSTGVDASLSAHGFFMLGNTSGQNLVLDDNEILARNNGAASTLYLQSDGGDFKVHHAMAAGNQFIVKEDGKVGIGTASPGTKLEVAGQVKITGGSPGANKVLTSDASGLASWQNTQGDNLGNHTATQNIQLSGNYLSNDGGNEGIFVATDGKVGIGTNTPDRELHINDGVFRMDRTSNSASFFFHRKQSDGTALKTFLFGMDASGVNNGSFFISDNGTAIGGASTKRLLIDNTGNVGLGTTTPLAKLHSGTTISDYSALDFSTTGAIISATSGDQDDAESNVLTLMRDGTSGVIYAGAARFDMSQWENSGTGARTKLDIKLANSATDDLASVLTMQSNGNVGIGSTSPGAKLHVAGNVKIDGNNTLEFGAGIAGKETNAGKIGYQAWSSDALDFVGAGTGSNRKMRFYAEDGAGFNGNLGVGTFAPSARLEVAGQVKITGGTPGANKVLTSDANGLASWQAAQGDNLGNHTATQNIQLGGNYLSNDGGNEGIFVSTTGNVGIGFNAPTRPLDIQTNATTRNSLNLKRADNLYENGISFQNSGTWYEWNIYQSGGASSNFHIAGGSGVDDITTLPTRLSILSGGNVGIGTTTPGAKLEVTGQVKITGGTPGANKVLTSDANGLASWQTASGDNLGNHTATQNIKLSGNYLSNDGGNEGIHIDNSGNVGIGNTANSSAKLKVTGNNYFNTSGTSATHSNNTYINGHIYFVPLDTDNVSYIQSRRSDTSGDASMRLRTTNNGSLIDAVDISKEGNVAIGATGAGAKLDVNGQIKIRGGSPGINKVLTSDANGLATWQNTQGDNLGNHTATQDIILGTHKIKGAGATPFEISENYLRFAQNQNTDSQIRSYSHLTLWANDDNGGTEHMIFKVGGTGTGTERMRLDASGNLGIGITSPSTKLDVNGQIKIRGGSPGLNKVLTSDANGLATWQTASGDNFGNHTATTNIQLGGHYLSNDGGNEGVAVDNSGNVGIGTNAPGAKLEVAGQVKITGGTPGDGKILVSDSNGLASWESISSSSEIVEETNGYIPNMTSSSQDGFIATSYNEAEVSSTFAGWHIFNTGLSDYYSNSINWSNPPTFQIQLPESIKIYKYYIHEDNGNHNYIPTEWTVEGSNNGTDWTILDSQTNFSNATMRAGAFIELSTVSDAYSYYRLRVTRTGGYNMLAIKTFQIYRAVEENLLQGLTSVLDKSEDGGSNRIINVSQVGINTSSPTATLSVNGDANKTGSTAWGTFSDIRLKDIQGNYTKGLQDISALHTVMYNYKRNNPLGWNSEQQQYGLIAQEVQHIFPEAVTTDNNGYLKLDVHPINMAVYNAIRELNEKVKTLEEENKRLRKDSERIKILEEKLEQLLNK
eukprot:TRINITY_DN2364_c0_g1_i1.p1 TRINITY_DN2364_c0_g1~~TRINITY_DN2364_c0_g1_i1.p1  ORF type:complete len:1500 (+),score=268.98 TRINITY_DN2364_c0_g1_i1:313-4812(+)